MANEDIVPCLRELQHTLRHTADHKVLAVKLHGSIVQCRWQRCIRGKACSYLRDQIVLPERQHKLFHIHGIHRFHIDFSNREGELCTVDGDAEQTSCNNDVIIRRIFAEVFERSQRFFTELHFIKHDERLAFHDGLSSDMG